MISRSDIKYTFRLLMKNPGFTILSVFVMGGALGVGILAFTFSYTLFYKPIPVTNGDRIYHLCAGPEVMGCRPMKAFEFAELRRQVTTLENIGVYWERRTPVSVNDISVTASVVRTEWNMFQLSQSEAIVGRTLQEYDQTAGTESVVVLGYDFWQQHFNGDATVIGSTLSVGDQPSRIVGVMPEGYLFPWSAELWIPATTDLLRPAINGPTPVSTFGLLKEGVSQDAASAEIANLMRGIRDRYPPQVDESVQLCAAGQQLDCDTGHIATFPLGEFGGLNAVLIIVLVGVLSGFIFALGVINVGTLLLARTNERLRDTSIRVALGAPRGRLLLQMTGESVVIASVGALSGILLAGLVMELLNILFSSIENSLMAFWQRFSIDRSTALGAMILVFVTVLLTSVFPAWRIINGNFNAVMRDGTRGALGLRPGRFSRALVVTSVFIITLLVSLVAIMGTYALNAKQVMQQLGFDGLMVAQPRFDPELYDFDDRLQIFQQIYGRLRQDPAIAITTIRYSWGMQSVEVDATELTTNSSPSVQAEILIQAGDMEYIGGGLLAGRTLQEFEPANSPPVALVNQSLAQQFWPEENAIGRRVRVFDPSQEAFGPWRQIVGVVSNRVTSSQLVSSNQNMVYVPLAQTQQEIFNIRARGQDASATTRSRVAAALSQSILYEVPELGAIEVFDAGNQMAGLNRAVDMGINLASGTALFAFGVAIVGIFGLTQNSIQAATQEIGTRRALGASDSLIRRTFLWRGGRQALTGLVLAMLIVLPIGYIFYSALGTEVILSVAPSMLVALLVLYGTIIGAIYIPVHRILQLEPSEALRYE